MIDVHVLTHSGTRSDWLRQCLASLENEPCSVHLVEGVEGSVGAGRADGYARGSHPYVSFVDSDDWVVRGGLQACIDALKNNNAVCTLERAIRNGKRFFRKDAPGHHLFACRREVIEPLLPLIAETPFLCDVLVRERLQPTQLDVLGYMWRIHDKQTHLQITPQIGEQEKQTWL